MMKYPGLAYIGSDRMCGLYGLNETIHDQKSIGLQHFYIDDYQTDCIYSATSAVKVGDRCHYGDRIKPKAGHPLKQASEKSCNKAGFCFNDEFGYERFRKRDSVYCAGDYTLAFECQIDNCTESYLEVEVAALVISTAGNFTMHHENNEAVLDNGRKTFRIVTEEKDVTCRVSADAPSGFMYHGIQDILFDENAIGTGNFSSEQPIAVSLSRKVRLGPNGTYTFRWLICADESEVNFEGLYERAGSYWNSWLNEAAGIKDELSAANLIALKAINMKGFIPADLTGHYFAGNEISFYVRDALHGARAFLYSGHYRECREVIDLIGRLPRKENNEIYQRYNSALLPDEGANNNVFSQIDVIGYLLRVAVDYYHLTSELPVSRQKLLDAVDILKDIRRKEGLYGPEGGVNEGVYGPAYITSTNIFIAAGLRAMLEILDPSEAEYQRIENMSDDLIAAINRTFLEEGYFAYGYVDYHDELVKRYDTPQLFGLSLGYPADESYVKNFRTLSEISIYYNYGYGYSEQEYHDGPWIFNTAFAAQNAFILEDMERYRNIMDWLERHKNSYGMLPEAIDARNENNSFINPLMWANAEYICARYADVIKRLRVG